MLYHAIVMGVMPASNHVAEFGWMGVDLFFALSGFLIGGQLFRPYARAKPEHAGLFYLRRLLRTLPPYLVVVALYFSVPAFRERQTIQPLWQFLTFTENLFIDLSVPKAFSHVWSLCIEEQFYLFTPIVVWLLMRRPTSWKAFTVFAGIVAGGMLLRGYIWTHDLASMQQTADGSGDLTRRWYERVYYPTWCRLDDLVGGVALAAIRAFRRNLWQTLLRRANVSLGVGIAAVGFAIWLFADDPTFIATVIGFPIVAFGMTALVAAGASTHGLIGRWRVPGAGAIAAMAYSLYLTHKQIYRLTAEVVGQRLDSQPIVAVFVYGGAAVAAGALLYATAERPALLLRKRLLDRTAAFAAAETFEPARTYTP